VSISPVLPDVCPRAVLLDYDGTLVDTEPYWMQVEIDVMNSFGVPWGMDDARQLCGTSREYSLAVQFAQLAAHGVDLATVDVDAFYEQLCQGVIDAVEQHGLTWLPGARELLADLRATGTPCAVVSNSPTSVLTSGLRQFPDGAISAVVDGDVVSAGKPDPEGYRLAAAMLGVDAADCIVVEDTRSGAEAGLAAGAVVVTVPGQFDVPDLPGVVKVPGLAGLTTARLREIFAEERGA